MRCDTTQPRVAVIGNGYWGKNLVRNFADLGTLACVCDVRQERRDEVAAKYQVRTTADYASILEDEAVQAVVIAAPAAQHYELAKQALRARKDVFVEKPLALRASEGQELVDLASAGNRILMVGHILEYHPAILELKRLVREGELGRIEYVYSSRLNLGKLRTEENILWSFAPHDISAILFLLNEQPVLVSAHGGSYLGQEVTDTTLTICDFKSGVKAHIFVSWLHPFKEQKLTIVADKKMAVFDDVQQENKLVLYSHRIDWPDRVPVAHRDGGQAVPLPKLEPLRLECEHFLECVANRQRPRTDGESALRVLRVLEMCEESLRRKGQPVDVVAAAPSYFAHPTAVIDAPCEIGPGTKIWHFSHIMAGSKIGKGCTLGQNVVVSDGVLIGKNVKIQNNVSVYTGVELEDDVFCGPAMVFTNVVNPRSHIVRRHEYKRTLVKRGASLGANSTIVCGITIGQYAFIAAGAVVTHDVPDYALIAGVPGRQIGWMCYCGVRLNGTEQEYSCQACGRKYRWNTSALQEVNTEAAAVAQTAQDSTRSGDWLTSVGRCRV
jgi:UDP-2-acetamido-3-amino-2,3-dideoxy-glucuronate N-acetyltransferase